MGGTLQIGLYNPRYPGKFFDERLLIFNNLFRTDCPNLTLPTLAALVPDDIEVKIFDENFQELDLRSDFDLVGITATTPQVYRAYEIAAEFQQRGIPVVIGGSHATFLPEEVARHADVVFTGDAEAMWPQLIEDFRKGQMLKRYDGKLTDLKLAPPPRYDLYGFKDALGQKAGVNVIPIQITRGCPYKCSFCSIAEMSGSKYRIKSVDQVLAEIETIGGTYPLDQVLLAFYDDNLFVNKKFIKTLFFELRSAKIQFHCLADISAADDTSMLELISQSGCKMCTIGLESIEPESLKDIDPHKFKYLPKYAEHLRRFHEYGIKVGTFFIFGWDQDTPATFTKTYDFVVENSVEIPAYFICTPLPGTRLERELRQAGRILKEDYWADCNFKNILFRPKGMSIPQLQDGLYQIYCDTFAPLLWTTELTGH